jgi:hypothetical protein
MPTVIAAPVQTVAILRAATDWTCLGMVTYLADADSDCCASADWLS